MTIAIEHDPINHPRHYVSENGLEVINVIEAYRLSDSFHLGSALKYMLRAGDKVEKGQTPQQAKTQDLGKAAYYCKRFHRIAIEEDGDVFWPCAIDGVDELMPVESVIREFKLEGALAEAVADLLNLCIGEETEPLEQCIESLERAIKEAA